MDRLTFDGNFCEVTHCPVQFDPERYRDCPCHDCTVWEDAKQQGGWIAELFARVPMMRRMTHKVADIEVLPGVPEKLMQFHAVNGAQNGTGGGGK